MENDVIKSINIIKSILNNDTEFSLNDIEDLERCYIRIILVKDKWKDSTIETFLSTHYEYENSSSEEEYSFIRRLFGVVSFDRNKGRPTIPNIIKEIIKKYEIEKNKQRMRRKYEVSQTIDKLFTPSDINFIINLVKNNETDKTDLISKLNILKKFC